MSGGGRRVVVVGRGVSVWVRRAGGAGEWVGEGRWWCGRRVVWEKGEVVVGGLGVMGWFSIS